MITAIVLATAIGAGAFIIAVSRLSVPMRLAIAKRKADHIAFAWLSDLINCPFCTAVWLSLAATAIYRPRLTSHSPGGYYPLGYLVTALAISAASMLPVLIIKKATEVERKFVNATNAQAK